MTDSSLADELNKGQTLFTSPASAESGKKRKMAYEGQEPENDRVLKILAELKEMHLENVRREQQFQELAKQLVKNDTL